MLSALLAGLDRESLLADPRNVSLSLRSRGTAHRT